MALCSARSGRGCYGLFLLFLDFGLAFFENVLYIARVMAVFYTVMVNCLEVGVVPGLHFFADFERENRAFEKENQRTIKRTIKGEIKEIWKEKVNLRM